MIASWKRMIGWTGDSGDSDACVQGSLKFTLSRDKFSYAVAGAGRSITSADIPETFLGKPVSSIGDRAFLCCPKLASISIPSSVSSIGENAFNGCSALASVSIPSSVVSIGSYAFCGCSKLASISIPSSVSSIGGGAFQGCSSLSSVSFGGTVAQYAAVAKEIRIYTGTLVQTVKCNDGDSSLGAELLKFVLSSDGLSYSVAGPERSITSADIPETYLGKPVSSIGENAFNGCSALASVSIPSSVVSIGSYAFCGCSKLVSIFIPSSVSSIGGGAFRDCSSLLSIFVDAMSANFSSVDGVLLSKDGTTVVAFPGGRAGTYAIPSSVVSIGCGAFEGCSKLTSVAIPGSVRAIGSFAFFWCSSLSSVSFGGTVAQCAAAIDKGHSSPVCLFNEFRTVECSDGRTHYYYFEIGFPPSL